MANRKDGTNLMLLPADLSVAPASRQKLVAREKNLKIIPLGGCEEVGRNMTVFEYDRDIVIVDMGLQFPEEDMPGIDYIIPNIKYLAGKEKNIRGIVFTHGHLDHVGAAPILLEKLGYPPIIGRPLTIALIKGRQEDYKKGTAAKLRIIPVNDLNNIIQLGKFTLKFFQVEHSIMDAMGIILETRGGTIIHAGDWSLERNERRRPIIDYSHLRKLAKPTILMLESLGSTRQESVSSADVYRNLYNIISQAPGRVIIGTFSSQIERISWIIKTAEELGKKIILAGYSLKKNIEIAKELGYVRFKKNTLIDLGQIKDYPDGRIIIICTGAQGERNAVLPRIVNREHRHIRLKKSDTIIFSSSIIPGHERTIQRLKDNIYRQSDHVIHSELMDVHISGHANRRDIADMIKMIKPTYFVPVYGNHYLLKEAAKLAVQIGFPKERIFVPDNGSIILINKRSAKLLSRKVPSAYVFVDGLGITDMQNIVLRDRQVLAEDGMVVVIVTVDAKTGKLVHSPDIISRGFIFLKENKALIEDLRRRVRKMVEMGGHPDANEIKNHIRERAGQFLFSKTEKRPMILPVVIEV